MGTSPHVSSLLLYVFGLVCREFSLGFCAATRQRTVLACWFPLPRKYVYSQPAHFSAESAARERHAAVRGRLGQQLGRAAIVA